VNVVIAVAGNGTIVGFVVLAWPSPDQRWGVLGPKTVMEVKGIEVTRYWRRKGAGKALVKAMVSHPSVEERILFFVGYTWIWDLTGAKLNSSRYRAMMKRLFEPFGFSEASTNEPNICLDPDNLFMYRVGENVSERLREDFRWLLFDVYPQ
jgi:acetoin utilization protein AcuA